MGGRKGNNNTLYMNIYFISQLLGVFRQSLPKRTEKLRMHSFHIDLGFFYAIKNRPYICILPGRIYLYMWMTNVLFCALLRRIFVSIFFFTKKKKYFKKTPREISKIICAWLRWISVGDVFFIFNQKNKYNKSMNS